MKFPRHTTSGVVVAAICAAATVGCGSSQPDAGSDSDTFTIAATTSVWGDVISEAFGDQVSVTVLMPPDTDPHHFEPSTKVAATLESVDLIVENGAGLEAGLAAVIDAAEKGGTPVFTMTDHVATRTIDGDEHGDADDHGQDDGSGEDDDHEGTVDPHIWLDPELVGQAVYQLGVELESNGVDGALASVGPYVKSLSDLNDEIAGRVDSIPADKRVVVTSHDSLGYYAQAYGLTVVDTIAGSVSTDAEPSVADLEDVVAAIDEYGVDAIFVDPGQSDKLAAAVASESDRDVTVVALPTDGLTGSTNYQSFMRDTTDKIVSTLTS